MSEFSPQFPEYGDSGDLIGARRARRAFRWGVALAVLFTGLLWVTESFWRYSPAERLYRSALTLLPEQGRNLLRQSVKYDAQTASPSSKYYEALAEREEDDLVVGAYENASKHDPQDADLAIKFGCQLAKLGLGVRAREQFRLAAETDTHNALADYLEAAILPMLNAGDTGVDTALSLAKQANSTGDSVAFPRPMWFTTVPREGYWYAQLRRQMTQFCGAPLEQFTSNVLEATEKELATKDTADTVQELQVLGTMGRRVALSALEPNMTEPDLAGGTAQMYLGLRSMSLAVEQQKRVQSVIGTPQDESAVALVAKLTPALRKIEDFEKGRQTMIEAERGKYAFPWRLIEISVTVTFGCFAAAYVTMKLLRVQGPAHSVRHSAAAKSAWGACFGIQVALLLLITAMQRSSHGELPAQSAIAGFWYAGLAGSVIMGIIAPAISLPGAVDAIQRLAPERRCDIRIARERRRATYASLVKRYYGIQLGMTLCALCIWIIVYRMFVATYPWMMPLLITGMESEEIAIMRDIVATLR